MPELYGLDVRMLTGQHRMWFGTEDERSAFVLVLTPFAQAFRVFEEDPVPDPDTAFRQLVQLTEELGLYEELPADAGMSAIAQARSAVIKGEAPLPEGDLISAAMLAMSAEGIQPRLERLALAGALIAAEISRTEDKAATA